MGPADLFLDFLRRIPRFRINRDFCSEFPRQRHLFWSEINCRDVQSHGLGVLDGHMAQAAHSGDHHPFTGPRLRHFQSFVGGDARAQDRGRIHKGEVFGNSSQIIRLPQGVLRERSVHRISGVLLLRAKRFPSGETIIAMSTGAVQPGDSDAVAFLQVRNSCPESGDDSRSFVTRNERHPGLDWPIAVHRMQIGVTYSSRKYLYQCLAWPRRWDGNFSHHQRLAKLFDNGCSHGFPVWHFASPSWLNCHHPSSDSKSCMYHWAQLGVTQVTRASWAIARVEGLE